LSGQSERTTEQQTNKQTKRKKVNTQFDEFTRNMARSVTRRCALKQFSLGLAGMALACFGLTSNAAVNTRRGYCQILQASWFGNAYYSGACVDLRRCATGTSVDCPAAGTLVSSLAPPNVKFQCGTRGNTNMPCSFTL